MGIDKPYYFGYNYNYNIKVSLMIGFSVLRRSLWNALTDFGKTLRKLRIDHDVNLKNMADGLGVTSAFLSGVETGRKAINPGLINKISEILNLSDAESLELNAAE